MCKRNEQCACMESGIIVAKERLFALYHVSNSYGGFEVGIAPRRLRL
jgi:hypothetical protein